MVGGSVNGRPFKPDLTSYEMTGIPCGNPQRYKSRGVVRMVQDKSIPFECQSVGNPGSGTTSEAQEHLKEMLDKQLDTDASLERDARKRKSFTQGVVYKDFSQTLKGPLTLEQFKIAEKANKQAEELQHLGLTRDEVEFKMEHEMAEAKPSKKGRYGENPASVKDRMEAIELKMEHKKQALSNPDTFANALVMSRHRLEVEKSLNAGAEKANTLSHLIAMETLNTPEDQALLEVLYKHNLLEDKGQNADKERHKNLAPNTDAERGGNTPNKEMSQGGAEFKGMLSTSFDHHSVDGEVEEKGSATPLSAEEGHTCSSAGSSPVIHPVPVEVIMRNKMTLEEIKSISKFQNYSPGDASQILYLKNLPRNIKEDDLVAMFIRFQRDDRPKLVFKLMSGRMRGQAFVTFPDIATATEAFDLVNGYKIKGRPVIIEFGKGPKRKNSSASSTSASRGNHMIKNPSNRVIRTMTSTTETVHATVFGHCKHLNMDLKANRHSNQEWFSDTTHISAKRWIRNDTHDIHTSDNPTSLIHKTAS